MSCHKLTLVPRLYKGAPLLVESGRCISFRHLPAAAPQHYHQLVDRISCRRYFPKMSSHDARADAEKAVKRNPHPDFKEVENSRPDWNQSDWNWTWTKTINPDWKFGDGANDGGECLKKEHVEIDPYEEGRPAVFNYKLLISGITPRFIGFVSTRSKDGEYFRLSLSNVAY